MAEKIECPKCKSTNLDIYDTDGDINDGYFIEYHACLNCGTEFDVKADFYNIEIFEK